ncbi:MAG: hypothetical protein ABFD12_11345 [Syntrophorhabdus sp.]
MFNDQVEHTLVFRIRAEEAEFLTPIYVHGFLVKSITGISVEDFLTGELGIPQEYVERRITTVFIDGAPIDDMGTVFLQEGMVLALSSAMPGLAGATLRRKGYLSSMRLSITRKANELPAGMRSECLINVKLFNILAKEIGPVFLKRGIYLSTSTLSDLLAVGSERFRETLIHGLQDMNLDPSGLTNLLRVHSGCASYLSL